MRERPASKVIPLFLLGTVMVCGAGALSGSDAILVRVMGSVILVMASVMWVRGAERRRQWHALADAAQQRDCPEWLLSETVARAKSRGIFRAFTKELGTKQGPPSAADVVLAYQRVRRQQDPG